MTELERLKPLIRMDLSRYEIEDLYEYQKEGLFRKALKIRYRESGSKKFMFLYWDGEAYSKESYLREVRKLEKPEIPLFYCENYQDLLSSEQIFIVEGEKDVRNLSHLGLTAISLKSGSDRISTEHLDELKVLKNKEILLIGDNDQTGEDYLKHIAGVLLENRISSRIKLGNIKEFWPQAREKNDISDWLEWSKTPDPKKKILDYFNALESYQTLSNTSFTVRTAGDILEMNLPQREWLIDGMLKDLGLTQLGGDSKLGKSLFAQQLSCAIASQNETFLGRSVKHGTVVYVDFENTDPIKQQRFRNFLKENNPGADRLIVVSVNRGEEIPRLDNNFIAQLDTVLKTINYEAVLVVIDTWTHIRSEAKGDVNLHDREESMKLFRYCDEIRIPFLLLTHTLKNTMGINKFNSFIGSTGIQGTMDTQMLIRENKTENCWDNRECILSIRGREVEEQEFVIFQKDGFWNLKGSLKEILQRREAQKLLNDPVAKALRILIDKDHSFKGTTRQFTKRCEELGISFNQTQKAITVFLRKNASVICGLLGLKFTELNSYKKSSHQTFSFRIEKEDYTHLKVLSSKKEF